MEWSAPTLWWLAAGALVAAELSTGTFYMLMLAIGAAAGALAAHAGFSLQAQFVTAAVLGSGNTVLWYLRRKRHPRAAHASENADVNMDIGRWVDVQAWATDGSAQVPYRGAQWAAQFTGAGTPLPGPHVIVAVHGTRLSLAARDPPRDAPGDIRPDSPHPHAAHHPHQPSNR